MEWDNRLFSINKYELLRLLDGKIILVQLRNGKLYNIVYNQLTLLFEFYDRHFCLLGSLCIYRDNLTHKTNSEYDIMKIYSIVSYSDINKSISALQPYLLWESRKEKVKLTLSAIAEKFGLDSDNIEIVE